MNLGRNTLVLPYCWVCTKRFKTSVPPGPAIRNDHHIIPRHCGGTEGPLVSLCDTHHSTVHRLAERLHQSAKVEDLFVGEGSDQAKKLAWLAQRVFLAECELGNDPNKNLTVSFSLSVKEVQVVDALRKRYGNVSRKELVLMGIALLAKNLE